VNAGGPGPPQRQGGAGCIEVRCQRADETSSPARGDYSCLRLFWLSHAPAASPV